MADRALLTLTFIERKSQAAGRVLTSLPPEDAAAFLDSIPTRYATIALSAMGAWSAASVIAKMSAPSAAAALREIEYHDAAAILRVMQPADRQRLLDELPVKLRRDHELSLSFPADTVGAKMNSAVIAMTGDHTISDAIDEIRRAVPSDARTVFVIDDHKMLIGAVTASRLLRHPRTTKLIDIADQNVTALSARARLKTITDLPQWSDFDELPVASRQKHVIGALPRSTVSVGTRFDSTLSIDAGGSVALSIFDAYLVSAAGLTQLLSAARSSRRKEAAP